MVRGRLDQHGNEANRCNHRCDCRSANGRGLRSRFEPTCDGASRHGARNPRQQQRGRHCRTHVPLRSPRGHAPRRGGSVRSLIPRPAGSTSSSPSVPLPRRSAVTLGPASSGPHTRPTGPYRHGHLPNATSAPNPSARDYHKSASSSHHRRPLTPSVQPSDTSSPGVGLAVSSGSSSLRVPHRACTTRASGVAPESRWKVLPFVTCAWPAGQRSLKRTVGSS